MLFYSRLLHFTGISIEIKGEANCSWTETKSSSINTGSRNDGFVTYIGTEEYFNHKYYAVGDENGTALIDNFLNISIKNILKVILLKYHLATTLINLNTHYQKIYHRQLRKNLDIYVTQLK